MKQGNANNFTKKPLGEASKNGAASTFGGVSTSDSEECRPWGLVVEDSSIGGEMSELAAAAAAAAAASLDITAGNLTQQHHDIN